MLGRILAAVLLIALANAAQAQDSVAPQDVSADSSCDPNYAGNAFPSPLMSIAPAAMETGRHLSKARSRSLEEISINLIVMATGSPVTKITEAQTGRCVDWLERPNIV
jgi:hypothetical protein